MPPSARRTLIDQYHGRRRALAAAAHAYLTFYERARGLCHRLAGLVCERYPAHRHKPLSLFRAPAAVPLQGAFLAQILWQMVSQEPMQEPRHVTCS